MLIFGEKTSFESFAVFISLDNYVHLHLYIPKRIYGESSCFTQKICIFKHYTLLPFAWFPTNMLWTYNLVANTCNSWLMIPLIGSLNEL